MGTPGFLPWIRNSPGFSSLGSQSCNRPREIPHAHAATCSLLSMTQLRPDRQSVLKKYSLSEQTSNHSLPWASQTSSLSEEWNKSISSRRPSQTQVLGMPLTQGWTPNHCFRFLKTPPVEVRPLLGLVLPSCGSYFFKETMSSLTAGPKLPLSLVSLYGV